MPHRYFTDDIAGGTARLTGPDAAHLARVLRGKPGQRVLLCNGAGLDYDAEVLTAAPNEVVLKVLSSRPSAAEPTLWAQMYIGLAKGERMDWAVQKCVELGASAIWPFTSQNTVVKPKNEDEKRRRFGRIAAEAAKQCGRGILPQVGAALPFAQALQQAAECDLALFFYEAGGVSIRQALAGFESNDFLRQKNSQTSSLPPRIALLTGPEGGFTPQEAEAARAAGCVVVHLGPRILRCETAPAAALAVVMALTGNLERPG